MRQRTYVAPVDQHSMRLPFKLSLPILGENYCFLADSTAEQKGRRPSLPEQRPTRRNADLYGASYLLIRIGQ